MNLWPLLVSAPDAEFSLDEGQSRQRIGTKVQPHSPRPTADCAATQRYGCQSVPVELLNDCLAFGLADRVLRQRIQGSFFRGRVAVVDPVNRDAGNIDEAFNSRFDGLTKQRRVSL